ncbi:MAG: hypothetical protein M0T70_09110 [Geobacteraceae bacterium]|nr:hypothetical protein [Geobacteraceae bacterium]
MYKKMSSLVLPLIFTLTVGMFLAGCSGTTSTSAAPVQSSKPAASPTIYDPPLKLVGEGEPKKTLTSWLFGLITEGLGEGATVWIGDNTTGRILNDIFGTSENYNAQFAAMTQQLDQIQLQDANITGMLSSLSGQMTAQMSTAINQANALATSQYANNIISLFNTNPMNNGATGAAAYGGNTGYMYFAYTATQLHPTLTNYSTLYRHSNPPKPTYQSYSATTMQHYPSNLASLKIDAATFHNTLKYKADLINSLNQVYYLVVPNMAGNIPILQSYAQALVANYSPIGNYTDAQNAMAYYSMLEQLFSQIISAQIKGNILLAESENYNNSSGALNPQTAIQLGVFQANINTEVAYFKIAVNYLMTNLIDYRKYANYNSESHYMHTQGVAPDDTYMNVFARSSFFCAQLMNGFSAGSGQTDTGLHGSIIVPLNNNAPGTANAANVTLVFTGYSTGSNAPPPQFPITGTPHTNKGRFPYTVWSADGQTYPDNNWTLYEFTADQDVPAGKYRITLADDGNSTTPWYHSTTDFGTVSVLYYDPANPGAGGSPSITTNNTIKFGSFSRRWNWGYNMIAMTKWTPANFNNSGGPNPFNSSKCYTEQYYTGNGTLITKSVCPDMSSDFYPNVSTDNNVFGINYPLQSVAMASVSTQMNFPFTMAALSPLTGTVASPDGATPSARLYYNITGATYLNNFAYDYAYTLNNSTANASPKSITLDSQANALGGTDNTFLDTTNNTITPATNNPAKPPTISPLVINNTYNLTMYAELYSNWWFASSRAANIKLTSDMQVIYDNLYLLPLGQPLN